ncbi:MAG TPA: DUF4149 domain-containing protein [Candidatus Binataceae bacterium]|nr:DUF4149 domain-containing protein [Candidatus Binataceae bacterium]
MILLFIYLLALVCWLGSIIFFSFFTAPVIFTVLSRPDAGKVVSVIFPRYYILGYVAGGIAFIIAIYLLVAGHGARGWWLASVLTIGLALGCTLYAGTVVRPRVDAIRTVSEQENPDPATKAEFDKLHHLSVILNGAVLMLDLVALFGTAAALAPRV